MSTSILVPHDGSSHAQAALEYALETFPNARIVLFHAIDPFETTSGADQLPSLTEEWLDSQRSEANALFERARDGIDDRGATFETETDVGTPAQTIVAAVEQTKTDQIVLGSHGRGGATDSRMGTTAEIVVKRASVPVTVVR
ncbi:universal stress protein [Natrarchaeobius halalkaliphilus]|uniref:Universal stress protein n=1 Tax=Natrarchaeobius halalkaliphilus TaxID=1679091 RepID=A0A3N6LLL0_9EURY|nr:universal stress protein [Natrarchaeobius halalkaliphilus]RQG88030.1 universal stress protein [Natrarchaeobius halalkaliphilus]